MQEKWKIYFINHCNPLMHYFSLIMSSENASRYSEMGGLETSICLCAFVWLLGLADAFRTKYYDDILNLNPQIQLIKDIYKQGDSGLGLEL